MSIKNRDIHITVKNSTQPKSANREQTGTSWCLRNQARPQLISSQKLYNILNQLVMRSHGDITNENSDVGLPLQPYYFKEEKKRRFQNPEPEADDKRICTLSQDVLLPPDRSIFYC